MAFAAFYSKLSHEFREFTNCTNLGFDFSFLQNIDYQRTMARTSYI
jgi:hypothetical protein